MKKITDEQWKGILNHCRSKIIHSISPESLFVENKKLRDELNLDHKGFYIGTQHLYLKRIDIQSVVARHSSRNLAVLSQISASVDH